MKLKEFKDKLESDMETLAHIIKSLTDRIMRSHTFTGIVKEHGNPDLDELYGFGSVRIYVPRLETYLWARQKRSAVGQLRFPPIDSWVHVKCFFEDEYEYEGGFIPLNDYDYYGVKEEFKVFEKIGFKKTDADAKYSSYVDKVRETPNTKRILESSDKFIFWYDEEAKTLDFRVIEGWTINLNTGDNGKVIIGNKSPDDDSIGAKTDIDIEPGTDGIVNINMKSGAYNLSSDSGAINITSSSGKIVVKTDSGQMELQAGSDPLKKSAIGEEVKSKIDDIIAFCNGQMYGGTGSTPPASPIDTDTSGLVSANIKSN